MFNNIKNRFISVIAPDVPPLPASERDYLQRISGGSNSVHSRLPAQQHLQDKFAYSRPSFLQLLTNDELRASADHNVRPIIVPRDINLLPWGTGYAECVNSGKSEWNEDQGAFRRQVLTDPEHKFPSLPYTYYGIFDGHAGYGAALAASHQFHNILHEKLVDCIDLLLPRDIDNINVKVNNNFTHPIHFQRRVTKDELIIGALESAFFHMDAVIAQDRDRYRDAGGCTACVALFIDGRMFVANAGDSRAVLCQRKTVTETLDEIDVDNCGAYPVPYSFDHTPETERERLFNVARLKPELMAKQYVAMEYAKRPNVKDMGQRILCRQGTMKGWTYKTLTREDLRMPVVTGEGKRSRLLGTLGVTRGFGDHELLAINTGLHIKPFLTPHPDVKVRDLSQIVSIPDEDNENGDYGILIMATDGLWDVSENEAVARTVFQTLTKYPTEKHRYTMVAQELVAKARGKINDSGHWRLADSKAAATVDDISVFVIPVHQYYKEHIEWTQKCGRECEEQRLKLQKATEAATEAEEEQMDEKITLVNGIIAAEQALVVEEKTTTMQVEVQQADDEEDEEIVVELSGKQQNVSAEIETQLQAVSIEPIAVDTEEQSDEKESSSPEHRTNKSKKQQQHQQQNQRQNSRKAKH